MFLQARNGVPGAGSASTTKTCHLDEIQASLKPGWSVHLAQDQRLYYCNHLTLSSCWLPPADCWSAITSDFPYGWEQATDHHGKLYFINHLNQTTTYEDPRKDWTEEPVEPRTVRLLRDAELGFGFVAGSEKPVIVRFVTEGSPSVGKLQPGDQILSINEEDVKTAPRDHVIKLVRACKDSVTLVVCQPPLDNSGRKSTLLSAAKKARLKCNPSRVRFAEGVSVNGSPLFPPSTFSLGDPSVPFLPNVLKVFLENGQTKSFKYDGTTTVRDVVESLQHKLCIKAMEHFSLVVEHCKSLRRNKLTLLDPEESLARIAARPGSHNLRCLFRATFVPREAADLAQRDLVALEYLFVQCCNDVVQERYAPELKYDIALRLAALHIHQHCIAHAHQQGGGKQLNVKAVEREFGLERFVPVSLIATMKRKELRKLIGHFLKLNHNLPAATNGQKSLTSLQAKLYYLNIIGELPSYGAKCFSTNVRDSNVERVVLVSPKFGISQIIGTRNSVPVPLADIEAMTLVTSTREDELSRRVSIHLNSNEKIVLSLEDRDAEELLLVLQGYYRLLAGHVLHVDQDRDMTEPVAPNYHSQHQVMPSRWSYNKIPDDNQHYATFTVTPPYRQPSHVLDNNMNNTKLLNAGGLDLQSVVSMEILESNSRNSTQDTALRRVQEMQDLVHSSEQYILSEQQREESDSDTPAPGELRHSDSLLLLTQGQKLLTEAVQEAVESLEINDTEPSESDTDSMNTPSNSPSHNLKLSDSSFGLHSPDNLGPPQSHRDANIQELLKRLQEDNCLPYNFAEGTLYLDPDIIDLTMIPPPMTPDDPSYPLGGLPPTLSLPPTPFADPAGDLQLDLESFLAKVIVQPPSQDVSTRAVELTPEEILSYIIPPPPSSTMQPPRSERRVNSLTCWCPPNQTSEAPCLPPRKPSVSSLREGREQIFTKSDQLLANYLSRLDLVVAQCLRAQQAGGGEQMDETGFQTAKEHLTNVARYLVTASKLLVKSANDGTNLAHNVSNCLRQVSQLTELAADVALHTTSPVQTRNLILKVRDVVSVFRATLAASLVAPNDRLLQQAENLASVLATLLRSLRVFSP